MRKRSNPLVIYKSLAGLAVGLILSFPALAEINCSAMPMPLQIRFISCLDNIVMARNPDAVSDDLEPDARELFMDGYNASPPPSAAQADLVRIYRKPGSSKALVVIGFGGRTIEAAEVPLQVLHTWRAGKPWQDPSNSL